MTGAELVVLAGTGEVVALDAPTDQIAAAIDHVRDLEQQLRSAKRALSDEVLRRMDAEATWTVHLPDWKVSGDGPGRVEYDGEELHAALERLVVDGAISRGAMLAAVQPVTTYKPRVAGINRLLKLGGDVAAAVQSCARGSDKPRSVRVTPAREGSTTR